jgi:hypothetical protein
MKSQLFPILSNRNKHERDQYIEFYEETHKYIITCDKDSKYTSVTTWNHSHFPHFNPDEIIKNMMKSKNWKEGHKYWGMKSEEIKKLWDNNRDNVAGAGTDMHYEIECFMNNPNILYNYTHKDLYELYCKTGIPNIDTIEWKYFIDFIKDNPDLKPYRTEWTIYHEELKLAGSVDMIYENSDGTLSIYDWKRSKNISAVNTFNKFAIEPIICHMPDSNFWHYALQLNTYKFILEQKYNKKIRDLYLVRLHPDIEEKTYELIKLPDLTKELNELCQDRIEKLKS